MKRGIKGFQPARLMQVLAARRLTQVQLAAMVGVSAPTISKWRNEEQAPEAETLNRLAAVVNVSAEWFMRSVPSGFSPPLYRSNASAHVAARSMLYARLEWAQDVVLSLSDFVDFPALNIPNFEFRNPEEVTSDDIEHAASACREAWRLGAGPIPDVALALESAGVVLVREETGVAQIEGLSAWSESLGRPFVLLSSDKDNGYRSRFDAAHELGHLVMHKHIQRVTDQQRHKELERQAHGFAGAFLLPAHTFASEIRAPVTLDSLLLLKQRWGVSVAAMIMRLEALGLIDPDEKLALFKRRSARWGAKAEPGDGNHKPEEPRLLRRTIDLLLKSGVMTLDSVPRHLGLSPRDIESLTGLPDGYFERSADVVELATLRKDSPKAVLGVHEGIGSDNVIQFSARSKS